MRGGEEEEEEADDLGEELAKVIQYDQVEYPDETINERESNNFTPTHTNQEEQTSQAAKEEPAENFSEMVEEVITF